MAYSGSSATLNAKGGNFYFPPVVLLGSTVDTPHNLLSKQYIPRRVGMSRYARTPSIILVLLLTLLFAVTPSATPPASAKPKDPPPCPKQEQTDKGCVGPDLGGVTIQAATYVQPPVASCLVQAQAPNRGDNVVIGRAEIDCTAVVTITLRACVQVGRWWGWQTLNCDEVTKVTQSTFLLPRAVPLQGTYTYRTYVIATATLGNSTGRAEFPSEGARYTFP